MPGLNQATIIGRVGKDPEVKTFANGGKIASFSIATSEKWKDKASGETKERTQWHQIVVKNDRLVDLAERYVKKGDNVGVVGAIETRKWVDNSGAEKYTTEIELGMFSGQIVLLGGGGGGNSSGGDAPAPRSTGGANASAPAQAQHDIDDDIPF